MTQAVISDVERKPRPRMSPRLLDESIMKEPKVAAQIEALMAGAEEKGVGSQARGIMEMYLNAMGGEFPLTMSRELDGLVASAPPEKAAKILDACASLMKQSPMAAEDIPRILREVAAQTP